ncbi:MAG: helix-turn-helix transcriptional regulator [Eggerthellaceae bacterium]|nr:helix-turn-helix transcriptional regulator [Eggerthellaceae bacterium]
MAVSFLAILAVSCTPSHDAPFIVKVYRSMFVCLIVGFLGFSVAPPSLHWIPVSVITCGAPILEQLVWVTHPEVTLSLGNKRLSIFGWATACVHIFATIGFIGSDSMISSFNGPGPLLDSIVCDIGILALVLLTLYTFKEKDFLNALPAKNCSLEINPESVPHATGSVAEDDDIAKGPRYDACRLLAEQYGLSGRELEVLEQLAAGQTVPLAAKKLLVSQSTVKTHIRHVYEKMGIHTRQELHDKILDLEVQH